MKFETLTVLAVSPLIFWRLHNCQFKLRMNALDDKYNKVCSTYTYYGNNSAYIKWNFSNYFKLKEYSSKALYKHKYIWYEFFRIENAPKILKFQAQIGG